MDAAVHAHPTERVVDVRGIAGEEDPAFAKGLGDALMHPVQRGVLHLAVLGRGNRGCQGGLGIGRRQRCRVVILCRHREHHAPGAGDAQQEVPPIGVGDVGHVGQAGDHRVEIERRGEHQESFRPGEALETDAERRTHLAAGAVGADQPASLAFLDAAIRVGQSHRYAFGILGHAGNAGAELDVEQVVPLQVRQDDAGQFRLFGLHAERMAGHVGDGAEVELAQDAVALGAVLQPRRLQPLRHEVGGEAEVVQHVERRRMKGGGARFGAQCIGGLEHRHRDALPDQSGRGDQSDRTGTGDEDPLFRVH